MEDSTVQTTDFYQVMKENIADTGLEDRRQTHLQKKNDESNSTSVEVFLNTIQEDKRRPDARDVNEMEITTIIEDTSTTDQPKIRRSDCTCTSQGPKWR